jgi:hypothetical protein
MRALIILGCLAAAAPAMAQTTDSPPLQAVYGCATISDAVQRLACFDAAVAELREAETTGRIVAIDEGRAETIQRESFGFQLPNLNRILPTLRNENTVDAVQAAVTQTMARPEGRRAFVLSNDQVWVQLEPQRGGPIRVGDEVIIRRAALGSYLMVPARGGPAHRVRREE